MRLSLRSGPVHLFVVAALVASASGCKTTTSQAKDLPLSQIDSLTVDQWTTACEKELKDPVSGKQSLADLKLLANTSDCRAAYPEVKRVVDAAMKPRT